MRLTLNGTDYEHFGGGTLSALLAELGIQVTVATMVNGRIISAANRSAVVLREHDRIEVIAFAGGG